MDIVINEATGTETYKMVRREEAPKDFKKTAISVIDSAEKIIGKKIGEGASDGFFGRMKYQIFTNARERVEKDQFKTRPYAAYRFVIPQKLCANILGTGNTKKYSDFIDNCLKAAGFKRGQTVTSYRNTRYYYKESPDKKYLYVAFGTSNPALSMVTTSSINIFVQCTKNEEKTREFVVESSMFSNIKFI